MIDWLLALALAAICPAPQVADLGVRPVSDDGLRIALRARAEMPHGQIGAFEVWWDNRSGLIADLGGRRRVSLTFEHRYPGPGSYRISVVAEGSTRGCRRLQKSDPATVRVRVPLATGPSSP